MRPAVLQFTCFKRQVPDGAIIRNTGNPLAEAGVWYINLRGNITARYFVRRMP